MLPGAARVAFIGLILAQWCTLCFASRQRAFATMMQESELLFLRPDLRGHGDGAYGSSVSLASPQSSYGSTGCYLNPEFCDKHIQIAPMLDVTDIHFRALVRLLTKRTELWTEMVVDSTINHNTHRLHHFLGIRDEEHPIIAQLGGNDPSGLASAAQHVERMGFDGINLNVGCPSPRVAGKGCFGAALMKSPELVAQCIAEMSRVTSLPLSIKTRLGVDDDDDYDFLRRFIDTTSSAGCRRYVLHARKAWLRGLSPAQNRSVPPLNYSRVSSGCGVSARTSPVWTCQSTAALRT
eukprot:GHVU01198957.1.p1 GENE.GHVU01198957.1~~GHVU01198957.1.p1  ORF type:complete len:294 (+),score=20.99 GHVU01198957.1:98-979(+)